MRKKMIGSIGLASVVLAATGVAVASSVGDGPGCETFAGPVRESKEFDPFEMQRSQLPDSVLNAEGEASARVPDGVAVDSLSGMPRQWAVVNEDGSTTQYFSKDPVKGTSLWEFQAAGGIQLETTPVRSSGMSVADLAKRLGDRADAVTVGDSEGLVVWADPENPSNQRLHHVYWEDDETQYALVGDLAAVDAVTQARNIACR